MNKIENNMMIGNRIARLRKAKKMQQGDLAKKINIHASRLGNYERGERSVPVEIIDKMADALNVPTWLLTRGLPDGVPSKYDYNFFANASDEEKNNFYIDQLKNLDGELITKKQQQRNFIENYIEFIYQYENLDAQNELYNTVKLLKEKTVLDDRLLCMSESDLGQRSKAVKKYKDYDSFEEFLRIKEVNDNTNK